MNLNCKMIKFINNAKYKKQIKSLKNHKLMIKITVKNQYSKMNIKKIQKQNKIANVKILI